MHSNVCVNKDSKLSEVNDSPKTGVAWLLLANCLERMAYYGFRAIFILFLVDQSAGGMGWSTDQALELYGEFTMYTYLALIIGGLCADFLFGAYISTLIGITLMVLGYVALGFTDNETIYYAAGIIAIGAGLFKPSIPTMITQQFQKFPEKLDSVFTGQYLVINFGAALSPLIVGVVGEQMGWSTGFNTAAVIAMAAFMIILIKNKHFSSESKCSNIKTKEKNASFFSGIGIVILTSALAVLFWTYFEVGTGILYDFHSEEMNSIGYLLSSIVVILSSILCTIIWWKFSINSWYKVAASFLIFSLSWFLLNYSISNEWNVKKIIILVLVLHGVAEVLGQIIFMSIIAKMCFKPLISTSFAIHLFASALANHAVSYFSGGNSYLEMFGWVCLLVGTLLILIPFTYNRYTTRQLITTS